MFYKKKAIQTILEEYLRKFPAKERKNLSVDLQDDRILIEIVGDIHSLRLVNVVVNVFLKHINFGDIDKFFVFDLSLSIEESMLNVYLHSYPSGKGKVEMELIFEREKVIVNISDYGEYGRKLNLQDRLTAPPAKTFSSTGRGFLLIKKAVDDISYNSNKGKNTLTLIKSYRG